VGKKTREVTIAPKPTVSKGGGKVPSLGVGESRRGGGLKKNGLGLGGYRGG